MQKVSLLFTKDGFSRAIGKGSSAKVYSYLMDEDRDESTVHEALEAVIDDLKADKIEVISALNHFAMVPFGFQRHDLGYKLISYNAAIEEKEEELMLAVNPKKKVQFYYTLPKEIYKKIKEKNIPVTFNFSGEKFLNKLQHRRRGQQIHVNLYSNQAEFYIFRDQDLLLYNNLDSDSEVDILYFIMFAVSKLDLDRKKLRFYLYGDVEENETFLSELQKFSSRVKIVAQNKRGKDLFILA